MTPRKDQEALAQNPPPYRAPLVHLNNTRNQPGANAYPFFEPFAEPPTPAPQPVAQNQINPSPLLRSLFNLPMK